MKEKDKVLQALCDGLGENYKLMEIDLELCIYRNFGNRFEVEVSGVHTAKQNKKQQSTCGVWMKQVPMGTSLKKLVKFQETKLVKRWRNCMNTVRT